MKNSIILQNKYLSNITTILTKNILISNPKRNMMIGVRAFNHVARTAYHAASTLSNDDMINAISSNKYQPLVKNLVEFSLDDDKGIPQQKTKITKNMLNHKFNSEDAHQAFQQNLENHKDITANIVKNEPHTKVDARFMNEYPAMKELLLRYCNDIQWVLMTNDARSANFPHQHQPNQDFWVMLKSKGMQKIDEAMGLGYKCVNHDEKSGMDMFHSSRGTLGVLTYEQNGVLIPFTNEEINLIKYNKKSIDNIRNIFDTQKNNSILDKLLLDFKDKFENLSLKTEHNLFQLHNEYQNIIWQNFQLDMQYDRSMSFIFTKEVCYPKFNNKQQHFADHFKSLLEDKTYNLDKRGDCQQIYKAMLIAYKQNVDSDIIKKLQYLNQDINIEFNIHFLQYVAKLMKDGLL